MKAVAIAANDLRRLFRWRANVFFLFILPMLIILLLGAAFGGASARIGVVGGDGSRLGRELVRVVDLQSGNALGAAAVIGAFCLVGTGAGMLLGTVASTEQQAAPAAFILGLGLAALGGSMVPLEVFPSIARTIADFTPHAWGNEAFSKLRDDGAGVGGILRQLAVLLLFGVALISLATYRLRRVLTR
jgi:ABC-2 type transport system permease protein